MKAMPTHRPTSAAENDVLRELFDTSSEALVVFDTARTSVLEANKGFLDLTGLGTGDVCGRPLADIGIFEPADVRKLLGALSGSTEAEFDSVMVRLAGPRTAPCRVLLRTCESDGRRYTELRINDATRRARRVDEVRRQNEMLEQRVAERTAELEETNRELEAFSYSASHDLRTPLRHVLGFAELLQKEAAAELAPSHLKHLESITGAAQRMNELIDDLLAFSQIGRSELHKRPVDLGDLLQAARHDLRCETEGRDIDWVIHPLPLVHADQSLLRQAMVNLVSNALKFTAPRKKARIEIGSSSLDPDETVVYVRDNGVGFDPQYAGKLFRVFQRLHHGRDFEGTGIGLANVRQIIRRHGGRVWAEGKPGEGATFYFTLPRTSLAAAP
jgi:light-regulated signal transduction histidine kinase (bacteriophytochrome)